MCVHGMGQIAVENEPWLAFSLSLSLLHTHHVVQLSSKTYQS